MLRAILSFIAALVVWVLAATLLNRLLRFGLPGYLAAEPVMTFTLAMQVARLAVGAVASLAAGYVVARFAPTHRLLPLALGTLLLLLFLPVHYNLWNKFPIWYHLVFLASLIPLTMVGARLNTAKVR
jgi:hypothetical protein